MTDRLPSRYADDLLWHVQQCMMCRMAKLASQPRAVMCPQGRNLILLTLAERHGRPVDG